MNNKCEKAKNVILKKDQPAVKGYRLAGTVCNLDMAVVVRQEVVGRDGQENGERFKFVLSR